VHHACVISRPETKRNRPARFQRRAQIFVCNSHPLSISRRNGSNCEPIREWIVRRSAGWCLSTCTIRLPARFQLARNVLRTQRKKYSRPQPHLIEFCLCPLSSLFFSIWVEEAFAARLYFREKRDQVRAMWKQIQLLITSILSDITNTFCNLQLGIIKGKKNETNHIL